MNTNFYFDILNNTVIGSVFVSSINMTDCDITAILMLWMKYKQISAVGSTIIHTGIRNLNALSKKTKEVSEIAICLYYIMQALQQTTLVHTCCSVYASNTYQSMVFICFS